MFPEKSGGLALYAHEAWRKYTTLVGPIATFGYWIGWSVVLASSGLFIGSVIGGSGSPASPAGAISSPTDTSRRRLTDVRAPCPDRDRSHSRRLALQRLRDARRRHVRLRRRGPADGAAIRDDDPAVPERQLRQRQPHEQARRFRSCLGRPAGRARLAVVDVLVGLGCGRLCDLRARVQGHRARHEARASVGRAVLDGGVHRVADRARRRRRPQARRGLRLSRRDGQDRRLDTVHGLLRRLPRRELHHHHEHGDRRRRSCALRDLS